MLRIEISNERQRRQFTHGGGPLELGRGPKKNLERFIIEDRFVSRDQMRIEERSAGRLLLHNLGSPFTLADGSTVDSGQSQELSLPVALTVGYTSVEIVGDQPQDKLPPRASSRPSIDLGDLAGDRPEADLPMVDGLQTISRPVHSMALRMPQASIESMGESPSAETLAQWFETVLAVQRAAAGSDEFYQETAKAIVELVGLDRGLILLRDGDDWRIAARHSTGNASRIEFSRRVLNQVLKEKRTFFQQFGEESLTQSLADVESVVASPIFDEHSEVVGVLYGSRSLRRGHGQPLRSLFQDAIELGQRQGELSSNDYDAARNEIYDRYGELRTAKGPRGIQPLEAQLVQLLGGAVSAGLSRMAREEEAVRARVQFEQFCSPELARALEKDPSLLDGHERNITVMFCDIRGYSRIAERLGTSRSFKLLTDVMERLTNCIIERAGVIIDYYGDGLAAMWNAPIDQPDHPAMACQAARDIVAALPALNDNWSEELGMRLQVGIGINSGPAQVGNAGSWRRRKYGPRGHTVNLASRVEGATKKFGVPILITNSTRELLPDSFATRRLCQVRVVNMAGAVTVYELCSGQADSQWLTRRKIYEQALGCYESRRWEEACRLLDSLSGHPDDEPDVPGKLLSERSAACNREPPDAFDPVFELKSK